jgi:hypothetical protein
VNPNDAPYMEKLPRPRVKPLGDIIISENLRAQIGDQGCRELVRHIVKGYYDAKERERNFEKISPKFRPLTGEGA